jgi:hypothetical protein
VQGAGLCARNPETIYARWRPRAMEFGYEDSCKIARAALHQSLEEKLRFGSGALFERCPRYVGSSPNNDQIVGAVLGRFRAGMDVYGPRPIAAPATP